VLRPEDITDQEVRGFNDGEVLQCVHNVDQILRDIVTPGFKDKPECKNTCAPGSSYTHASTQ
jgi:hypothetical protein